MLRSLYAGIAGMQVNQEKMDVIGNNIANVGTTAFKGSRVRFQDMLSQSVTEAMGPATNQGGVNPSQIGLGVKLAGVDTIMSQGTMEPTNRDLDVAVDGDGYFIVGKGPNTYADGSLTVDQSVGHHNIDPNTLSTSGMTMSYTRDGSFTLDSEGNLLTSDGLRVMGYSLTTDSNTVSGTGQAPAAVSKDGLSFQASSGTSLNGYSFVIGNVGAGTPVSAAADTSAKTITINGDPSSPTFLTDLQTAIDGEISAKNISGQAVSVTGTLSATAAKGDTSPAFSGGTPVQSLDSSDNVNFVDATKNLKSYDNNLKSLKIPDKVHDDATNQDLRVTSYSIGKNGVISAVLEDGRVTALGQIAMATFKNPEGLKKLGNNLNEDTVNSGTATLDSGVGTAGEDNSKGYGDILQGMLEMSNVDLAQQFTDMITTQRAFEASGKLISAGDEILQDIINLKR